MSSIALDDMASLILAYKQAAAEAAKWAEAADVLKRRIQDAMGRATEATVDGAPVYTWRHNGQFNAARFITEQPELASEYTRTVTREEIDADRLKAERPELFASYRARRFEQARRRAS